MYGGVSPAKIRWWIEGWERMDGPIWKLALKWMIFLLLGKSYRPDVIGQQLASELWPPILLLAATLTYPWLSAACPYLAFSVFLNSWVSERGMRSGAQTFGWWSKSIIQNLTPELHKFPSEEESVFTAKGQSLLCPCHICSKSRHRVGKVCHFATWSIIFILVKRCSGLHNNSLLSNCFKPGCWMRCLHCSILSVSPI